MGSSDGVLLVLHPGGVGSPGTLESMMSEPSMWLRAALAEMNPGLTPVAMTRPAEGIANEVFLVETTAGPVVVKRYDDARRAQAEVDANVLMWQAGLPAPQSLGTAITDGGVVVAFERMPGVTWNVALGSLAETEIERSYGQLGALVARIHGVVGSACGRLSAGKPGRSWREVHAEELAHFRGVPPGREAAFLASYTAAIPLAAGWESRARVYEVSRATAWAVSVLRNRAAADSVEAVRGSIRALVAGE